MLFRTLIVLHLALALRRAPFPRVFMSSLGQQAKGTSIAALFKERLKKHPHLSTLLRHAAQPGICTGASHTLTSLL